MLSAHLIKGTFQDSVTLMVLSRDLSALPEVDRVSVMMGTSANKDVYRETGLWHEALADAAPNDLCVVVDSGSSDPAIAEGIAAQVKERLAALARGGSKARYPIAHSFRRALALAPKADVALISVAGQYAHGLAGEALDAGLNVMIFSDNVEVAQERDLKDRATARGLLVMGPDCGTAIVHGAPLAFANRVPAGSIGVVGASGTGIQELTCQIARRGGGITHALGLGGRDLSDAVGGLSAETALDLVAADAATRVVAFVSKPPAAKVRDRLLEKMGGLGKPVVALFLGDRPGRRDVRDLHLARTLDEAAALAVELAEIDSVAASAPVPKGRGIRGLFTGGTLAGEAAQLLAEALDLAPDAAHADGFMLHAGGHRIVDLGDDVYTRGRPHPMIDPFARNEMIRAVADDADAGVLLVDVVLGFGSHADPAGEVARSVEEMRTARGEGAPIAVVATLTGTPEDPQDYLTQARKLEDAGILIAGSVRAAVLLALRLLSPRRAAPGQPPALLAASPVVVNIGLRGFADDLAANGVDVVHLQWEPPAEGSDRLRRLAAALK
ncbi:putative acyl-CoA synthetase with NAD(P)-binding Rossmann-fold domain [uncultured Alphaproteobacteria bacterium]|uniref:Putative acyl-CoA synthetase with NAD(P)-binding Rossmann-fold domain n=1 Tax=uncultured Alphaproteobacteria bacterium TaxID=91750 RepID=A0A212KME5_9PROT|nr:putative acyl-CoA synthetase with NAD(P)-binding Rossmann-fold domain [uncultured Alphaproteobacteria bacterium]